MNNYDNMTQKQLRPACKAAGIKYGKMNVTQMRQALTVNSSRKTLEATGSAVVGTPTPKAESKPRAGTIIKNGARQPGEGTKCRAVWDTLDDLVKNRKVGENDLYGAKDIMVVDARILAETNDWNMNNTVIEFYQWRKFHGLGKDAS